MAAWVDAGKKGGMGQSPVTRVKSLDELDDVIGKELAEKARKDLEELQQPLSPEEDL